uniref:Uncharacterized protein n=1 Tax=Plectus sambesii TaxID=2011161 RepID=A0A914UW10_9BILA
MQPPNESPRPPVRGDSAWGTSSNPHRAAATPTNPTAASNHVPLPERRRPQRAVWYKRAWDWIHDHPKISVPLLIGALLTVVIVIVVVAVTVADHKESEVTTTTATPNIRQYGIS